MDQLPVTVQRNIINKRKANLYNRTVYYLVIDDITYRCKTVVGITKTLVQKGGVPNPDRSNIYKVIRKGKGNIYGYLLYTKEEDK